MIAQRERVRFTSAGTECAAWHYPGTNGGCVVMAGGLAVPKEPGTDRFAQRFHQAGYTVLAFDYRHVGESGGEPRQVVRVGEQVADWHAALAFAATLPGVDPAKVAAWGYSLSGGHVFRIAASSPGLAAAVAVAPNADGQAAVGNASRHQTPAALARFTARALADGLGSLVGRPPRLVPLAGAPGTVAALTTPDALDAGRAFEGHADWRQEVAAWSALRLAFYRPGRAAPQAACPLLVVVCEDDRSALAQPAVGAAQRSPRGELVRLRGGHYAPFLDEHERAVDAQLAFLARHLLGEQQGRA